MKDIFIARQPIFDSRQRVIAYELLYRSDGKTKLAGDFTDEAMSSSVLVDGVLGMGLKKLTEGHTAFINLSEKMLFDGTVELLDPTSVVIEILESVRPTEKLVDQCRALVAKGYRLALDDFVFEEAYRPLLGLVEFVKIDLADTSQDVAAVVEILKPFGIKLLAEKVENIEIHERCVELGFEYFQGFHYFRPETVSKRDVSAQSLTIVRLMNMLQDENAADRSIEEAFRSDPALTYKLLRIVNSAALGGRGVQSIPHALRLLGRQPLHRWLCLLLVAVGKGGGDVRLEIIKASLLRGRMCEALAEVVHGPIRSEMPSGGAMFLVGLFARIDQLLGAPVVEILEDIDVTPAVREALLERTGHAGTILKAAEAYADAEWTLAETGMATVGGDPDALPEIYLDALTWASSKMSAHTEEAA